MKFLLEFVACYCGSSPSEDATLLAVEEPRRRVTRKQDRAKTSASEWRPSLSSISEDASSTAKKNKNIQRPAPVAEGWHRSLKRKVASKSQREYRPPLSSDHRRADIMSVIPTFSAPFMF